MSCGWVLVRTLCHHGARGGVRDPQNHAPFLFGAVSFHRMPVCRDPVIVVCSWCRYHTRYGSTFLRLTPLPESRALSKA